MRNATPEAPISLLPSDAAILEGREERRELPCSLRPASPQLGFDLAFHGGYEVTVPLSGLGVGGNDLTIIFRLTPQSATGRAVYFSQKWTVPPLEEGVKGAAYLRGEFVLGEGKYQVDWLMRDRAERVCSAFWRVAAGARAKDQPIEFSMKPGAVRAESTELFGQEGPVTRDGKPPLHVLVLFHAAPQAPGAATISPVESQALVSILRSIAREPRIRTYSIAAFNLERAEVLYRREGVPQVDFPALGEAMKQLRLGAIDVRRLKKNDSGLQFLTELIEQEMAVNRPDALVFVGAKGNSETVMLDSRLRGRGAPNCPVFYLTYNQDPNADPWRDAIGSVVKIWRGFEYTISRPRDLFLAWSDVMSRITGRQAGLSPEPPTVNSLNIQKLDPGAVREHR
jgi:hypothetical protein